LAAQEADGRVNFIWLPQILNVPQPSRWLQEVPAMPLKDENC
jgi:hypothetical protein